jgi:hypothetical protein
LYRFRKSFCGAGLPYKHEREPLNRMGKIESVPSLAYGP